MAEDKVKSRDNWDFMQDCVIANEKILEDKQALINQYYSYMLARTQRIFEYDGLPETLSVRRLELVTQTNGYSFIADVKTPLAPYKPGLYALFGFGGGVLDPNLLPTEATINNVALGYNAILTIGKDCVMFPNDSSYIGLNPMFSKNSALLADAEISLRYATMNARIPGVFYSDSDQVAKDIKKFFKDVANGTTFGCAVGGSPFFEGVKNAVYSNEQSNTIKDIIEEIQYLKASWYLDLGLPANYNMKREAINGEEVGMNDKTLLPLIDDMLHQRQESVKKINELFGTNISVKLSSAWADVREDIILSKQEAPKEETKEPKEDKEDAKD